MYTPWCDKTGAHVQNFRYFIFTHIPTLFIYIHKRVWRHVLSALCKILNYHVNIL